VWHVSAGVKAGQRRSLLNVLKELQKVCNHPYLLPNQEPKHLDYESKEAVRLLVNAAGKFQLLQRLLPALRAKGHRTLIFSQVKPTQSPPLN
jgi:SNF2 family DNA or RNA helicase